MRAAKIAADNGGRFSESTQSPGDIFSGKEPLFPIGGCDLRSQAIHVDGDIDWRIGQTGSKSSESLFPIFRRDASPSPVRGRAKTLDPGPNF
jgi:hypothetical protein